MAFVFIIGNIVHIRNTLNHLGRAELFLTAVRFEVLRFVHLTTGNKKSKETGRRKGLNPVLQIRNRMRQLVTRKKKPPPSNKI